MRTNEVSILFLGNPCIFHHKGNCSNGVDCGYCHEKHDQEYFKFAQKRNRALRMAKIHGDEPRMNIKKQFKEKCPKQYANVCA